MNDPKKKEDNQQSASNDFKNLIDIFKRRIGWLITIIVTFLIAGPSSFWIYEHFAKEKDVIDRICERIVADEFHQNEIALSKFEAIQLSLKTNLNIAKKMHDAYIEAHLENPTDGNATLVRIFAKLESDFAQSVKTLEKPIEERQTKRLGFNGVERIKKCIKKYS